MSGQPEFSSLTGQRRTALTQHIIQLMLQYMEVSGFLGLIFDIDYCLENLIWLAGSIFRAVCNSCAAVLVAPKTNLESRPTTCLSVHMLQVQSLSFLLKIASYNFIFFLGRLFRVHFSGCHSLGADSPTTVELQDVSLAWHSNGFLWKALTENTRYAG